MSANPEHIGVRPAEISDTQRLVVMGAEFTEQYGNGVEPCIDSMVALIEALVSEGDGALFVAVEDGFVCGMVGVAFYQSHLNQSHRMGQELFFWVDEDYRGGPHAKNLLDSAELWASENDCDKLALMSVADLRGDAVGLLYSRRGYKKAEITFYKEM